jgi:diguanylate cyclase (GGDEF)-like protein/PAS domain S-box-containing protein
MASEAARLHPPEDPLLLDGVTGAVLEAALDCIVVMAADGSVAEWNPAAEQTFGYTREEAVGSELAELIVPPALRDAHRAGLARYLDSGEERILGRRLELGAMRADGSELPVELTITRLGRTRPLFIGYMRDITQRRRDEAELRREADRRADVVALGQAALSGLGLTELMERALALGSRHLGFDFGQVWEALPGTDQMLLRAAAGGWPQDYVGVHTVSAKACWSAPPFLARRGVASSLNVPIPGPGRPFGVLSGHALEERTYDEADAELLESIGNVLGAAIGRRVGAEAVEEAERRYRTLVERLPVVTYSAELGPAGRWTFVSPQIEKMTGYSPAEWTADPDLWFERLHPADRDHVMHAEARCDREGGSLEVEYRLLARDGRVVWVRDEGVTMLGSAGGPRLVEGVLVDITEQRLAAESLRYHADHDVLTGLVNRRRFEEELERCGNGSQYRRGAVVIVDVDHFKFVNDSLGHSAGDAVLRGVATSLRERVGASGLPARLGGDEFAVLLPGAGEHEARELAVSLLHAVRGRETRVPVTASAGIAVFEAGPDQDAADALVAADIALYEAKEEGRDRVATFTGQQGQRLTWVGRIRRAIDEERLVLYAQPIVDLASGETVGEELLVRMLDEAGALVSPAAFLPTAERFGLIRDIDRWVVGHALELTAAGRRVSVNLSARSVADPELTRTVESGLHLTGADPARLTFEITETAAAADMEEVRAFAGRVERIGCGLALDDFGTGFGSFIYLKHLPVSELKIDMEFVRHIATSAADRRLVESIVLIASGLGVRTVAEGVEDAASLALLRKYGVDRAQGWHLGAPAPVEPA